ncbi:MAG: tetratricopeptide repeat protein [Bacteroidota bacterium]
MIRYILAFVCMCGGVCLGIAADVGQSSLALSELQAKWKDETLAPEVRLASARVLMSHVSKETGQLFALAQEAEDMGKQESFPDAVLFGKMCAAVAHQVAGDGQQALKQLRNAHTYAKEVDKSGVRLAPQWYDQMGKAWAAIGPLDTAMYYFHLGLNAYKEVRDSLAIAKTRVNIAVIHARMGRFRLATSALMKALEEFRAKGDRKEEHLTLLNIGELSARRQEFDEALSYYEEALAIENDGGWQADSAALFHSMGNLYYQIGAYPTAEKFLSRSMVIREREQAWVPRAHVLQDLSKVFVKEGKIKEAEQLIKEAEQVYQVYQNPFGMLYLNLAYAELYSELNSPLEIKKHATKAHKLAESLREAPAELLALGYLYKADSSLGNYQEALNTHLAYRNLEKRLYSKEQAARVAELQIEYESEKKEAENQLLKQGMESAQHKLTIQNMLITMGLIGLIVVIGFSFGLNQQFRARQKTLVALRAAHQEIKAVNGQLEQRVAERTHELEQRNEQLEGYAFMNSHRVRAPLARILGLIQLIHMPGNSPEQVNEYLEMVKVSSEEMDEVITDINAQLSHQLDKVK